VGTPRSTCDRKSCKTGISNSPSSQAMAGDGMTDSPDSIPIGVRCPRCGNKDERALGWLRERTQIFCPACGAAIAINQEKLADFLHQTRRRAADTARPAVASKERKPRVSREIKIAIGFVVAAGTLAALAWFGDHFPAPPSQGLSDEEIFGTARTPPGPPVPTCTTPPLNDNTLVVNRVTNQPAHSLKIRNGNSGNAIVKVKDARSHRLVVSFFVAAKMAASFDYLPDGDYRIEYALGTALAADCLSFADPYVVKEFPDDEVMVTKRAAGAIYFSTVTYTLYAVAGGTVRPQTISIEEFNKD
jgi:ribosomal protein S27E